MGVEQSISVEAGYFTVRVIPYLWMFVYTDATKQYLNSQRIFRPQFIVQISGFIVNFIINSLITPSLGFSGVAYSLIFTYIYELLCLFLYSRKAEKT